MLTYTEFTQPQGTFWFRSPFSTDQQVPGGLSVAELPFTFEYGTCKIIISPTNLDDGAVSADSSTWSAIWATVSAIQRQCVIKADNEGGFSFAGDNNGLFVTIFEPDSRHDRNLQSHLNTISNICKELGFPLPQVGADQCWPRHMDGGAGNRDPWGGGNDGPMSPNWSPHMYCNVAADCQRDTPRCEQKPATLTQVLLGRVFNTLGTCVESV
ncbi:MAG: hypothetical protein M1812_003232 [Candelaria pacifica]|nr:MAG: hypothetical protein M1812_003232 [Candelaria pacifica]